MQEGGGKGKRTRADSVRDEARRASLYLITNSKSPAGERGSFHPSTPLLRHHPRSLSTITPLPLSRSKREPPILHASTRNDHRNAVLSTLQSFSPSSSSSFSEKFLRSSYVRFEDIFFVPRIGRDWEDIASHEGGRRRNEFSTRRRPPTRTFVAFNSPINNPFKEALIIFRASFE